MTTLSAALEARDKATPGPWKKPYYDNYPGDGGWWIHNGTEGAHEYAIAVTFEGNPKAEHDALLIAAAPDMAAMNKVYQFAVAECDKITGHEPRPAPTMELVRDDEKHKAARLFADLKAVEMTMNDNGWLSAVLDYRTRRGDYGEHLRIGAKPRWTL